MGYYRAPDSKDVVRQSPPWFSRLGKRNIFPNSSMVRSAISIVFGLAIGVRFVTICLWFTQLFGEIISGSEPCVLEASAQLGGEVRY